MRPSRVQDSREQSSTSVIPKLADYTTSRAGAVSYLFSPKHQRLIDMNSRSDWCDYVKWIRILSNWFIIDDQQLIESLFEYAIVLYNNSPMYFRFKLTVCAWERHFRDQHYSNNNAILVSKPNDEVENWIGFWLFVTMWTRIMNSPERVDIK